eukprot:COSAG02_NODE_784_length_17232_cov_12.871651_13_plen_139_part_00
MPTGTGWTAGAPESEVAPLGDRHSYSPWGDHSNDAALTAAIMAGDLQGVLRDSELRPELLESSKELADQMFLKLLRKEFKDGSYYRTIIARFQGEPSAQLPALQNGPGAVKKVRGTAYATLAAPATQCALGTTRSFWV